MQSMGVVMQWCTPHSKRWVGMVCTWGYASVCVRLDARHGGPCGWAPVLGCVKLVVCQWGRCSAMAPLIRLVARHGVRWVSSPPWRALGRVPAMAVVR